MITISTWNVNSVKSRLHQLVPYLKNASPDIVLLQETKCLDEAFPVMEIEDLGYNLALHGQKTYNGVAVLSKYPIDETIRGLPGDDGDVAARYIESVVSLKDKAIRVVSVYVPNGQEVGSEKFAYKKAFLDRLYTQLQTLLTYEEILVVGGDYNVAPEPMDVYDPKSLQGRICFHPEEQARFRALLHLGFTDAYRILHPQEHQFSWWDYRGGGWEHNKGMRIDHLLLSPEAADILHAADIEVEMRGQERSSDHVPVWCRLGV